MTSHCVCIDSAQSDFAWQLHVNAFALLIYDLQCLHSLQGEP